MRFVLAGMVLVEVATGCRRSAAPSPEFQEAFALYNQLYARGLDDAYGDPQMERVVDLLGRVNPNSSQAGEAQELLAKVKAGIDDFQASAARVRKDQAALDAPVRFEGLGGNLPAPAAKPAAASSALGPSLGMTRDQFVAKFGDCFERRGDFEQGEKRGEAFALTAGCATRYPALTDSLVVLLDNKISQMIADKDVSVRTVGAAAEAAPVAQTKSPPPPPPPPPVRIFPGMPLPENAAPPAP